MIARKFPGRSKFLMAEAQQVLIASATLAEINAGKVIYAQDPNIALTITGITLIVTGTFTTLTDLRLSSYDSAGAAAVDVATVAAANLGTGVKWNEASAEMVLGAGFAAALASDRGLQIRKTGGTAAGGTSVLFIIKFTKTQS